MTDPDQVPPVRSSRRRQVRGGGRKVIVSSVATVAVAACLAGTSPPGHATLMATATVQSGAFGVADKAGPHVAKPVIGTPVNGSVVVSDKKTGAVAFAGTGQPGASLELYYRTSGTAHWKKLDGFTAAVGADGKWRQSAPLAEAGPTAGTFDFHVRQTAGDRLADSDPVTVTVEKDGAPCSPSAGFSGCLRFPYTGGDQSFVVPKGVRRMDVRLWGRGRRGASATRRPVVAAARDTPRGRRP